jgi:4-alpha-glucanotransferase
MSTDEVARRTLVEQVAPIVGLETSYRDVRGSWHEASTDSMLAVLRAMGHGVESPTQVVDLARHLEARRASERLRPVVVSWTDAPLSFELRSSVADPGRLHARVLLSGGGEVPLGHASPGDAVDRVESLDGHHSYVHHVDLGRRALPPGRHRLVVELPGADPLERPLLHAARRMVELRPEERSWGAFAPLYSLRPGDGSSPTVADLGRLAHRLSADGAGIVGTLPILAAYLDEPFEPSPYSPVSRRFWNEIYVDHHLTPGVVPDEGGPMPRERGPDSRDGRWFDHRAAGAQARRRFDDLLGDPTEGRWPAALERQLSDWVACHPDAADYARFRANVDLRAADWRSWPDHERAGDLPADRSGSYWYHLVGQFEMRRQLLDQRRSLEERGQRLYLDLPVGSHPGGYDTWRDREAFAAGARCGAPPDEFFPEGQTWGFPPMDPAASRRTAHVHFQSIVAHHMEVAGVLRLDHVMGLHRMFWVPEGYGAGDGVYVRYPLDELLAVLAIESHHHDCAVVGENLGTVPDEVDRAIDEHGLLGMYVAEFNVPSWPGGALEAPAARTLACVDTHDTPTFAGWRRGADLSRRLDRGLADRPTTERSLEDRRVQGGNLLASLTRLGLLPDRPVDASPELSDVEVHGALARFLAQSDAAVVLVALEDLWGEVEPQNVPGSGDEHSNWTQRFPEATDQLLADPSVRSVLDRLGPDRLRSRLRRGGRR